VIGFNASREVEGAVLNEHPASLVVGSVRDLFDLERLRQLAPDKLQPMPSPNPPYELCDLPLGDAEALLVLRATGARSVSTLIRELGPRLDERAVRANVYALLALGVFIAGRITGAARPA
jgi:hypothetical protein